MVRRPSSVRLSSGVKLQLLWNRWTEFNETWQEARYNVIHQVCVFLADSKNKMAALPLIVWDIYDFSSETAIKRNSTKLDRKQDLNVLYQVCVFRADRKNKMATLAYEWLRHFRLLLWNRLIEFNQTSWEARSQHTLPSGVFRVDLKNKMAALACDWLRHFRPFPWNHWMELNETCEEARAQRTLRSLCFRADPKKRWPPWPLIGWGSIYAKHSVKICDAAEWKSTKFFWLTYHTLLSNAKTFRNDFDNKRSVWMKLIS